MKLLLILPRRALLALLLILSLFSPSVAAQTLSISRVEWQSPELRVEGRGTAGQAVTVSNATDGVAVGSTTVSESGRWTLRVQVLPVPDEVRVQSAGVILKAAVRNAPASRRGGKVSLTGLSINGPGSVPEKGTAAFTASATFNDGTSKDVTSAATWSDDSSYVAIAAGLLTVQDVPADQNVNVIVAYTQGRVTKTAQKAVV
ncbi:MAG: hypothetical protein EHM18_11135, partial [Acidobacteria bacterium]